MDLGLAAVGLRWARLRAAGLRIVAPVHPRFLSEEFFPGYHVLEQVAGSKYRVYERSEWNASAPELDLSKIEGLYALLRIAPREPLQLPCAFFSPQGQMLELRGSECSEL